MYTNRGNIDLSIAVWLAADDGYDLKFDPNVYSVTTLLQPIRSMILSRRLQAEKMKSSVDVSDLIASRLGNAVHSAVEISWIENRQKALRNLNVPQHVIDRIHVNADSEDDPDGIYVYIEQRASKEIEGVTVTGKFDIVVSGRLKDVKTTKVYTWIKSTHDEKWSYQGSMYRWLNPKKITDSHMDIEYLFTDWSAYEVKPGKNYPPTRAITKAIELMSIADTEQFVRDRIKSVKKFLDKPQEALPLCTPTELWIDAPKWAYYSKVTNKNATKLYDTAAEAHAANSHKLGKVEERKSEPTFCKYCDARPMCTQAEQYEAEGLLKL